MKIYLHLGYHKTGSSFLQMMLSQNRKQLLENKIYYPIAERDNDAKRGRISPGNGIQLALAISNKNKNEFYQCFLNWIDEANKNGCDTLLISSEGLFHSLANNEYSELFKELKKKAKISEIKGLVFMRDPFDHIISLYKHRNKRGEILNFADWVENDYETLNLTKDFIIKSKSDGIIWTFRKYQNNSEFMAECLFSDWLKIERPIIPLNDKVNMSMTLSEILVLRELNKSGNKEAVLCLQSAFTRLNVEYKATDIFLKGYYRLQLDNWLNGNEKVLININKVLPPEEKLELYSINKNYQKIECASLSPHQIRSIIQCQNVNRNSLYRILNKFIFKK